MRRARFPPGAPGIASRAADIVAMPELDAQSRLHVRHLTDRRRIDAVSTLP